MSWHVIIMGFPILVALSVRIVGFMGIVVTTFGAIAMFWLDVVDTGFVLVVNKEHNQEEGNVDEVVHLTELHPVQRV